MLTNVIPITTSTAPQIVFQLTISNFRMKIQARIIDTNGYAPTSGADTTNGNLTIDRNQNVTPIDADIPVKITGIHAFVGLHLKSTFKSL